MGSAARKKGLEFATVDEMLDPRRAAVRSAK